MANYLFMEKELTSYDRYAFQYTYYMETYEVLKPYFQDMNQEAVWNDEEDALLCIEVFREMYRSRLREDPSVA